jgi:hypothetical protein
MRREPSSSRPDPIPSSRASRDSWVREPRAARRRARAGEAGQHIRRAEFDRPHRAGHRPAHPDRPDPDPGAAAPSAGVLVAEERIPARPAGAAPAIEFQGPAPEREQQPVQRLVAAGYCRRAPCWRRPDPGQRRWRRLWCRDPPCGNPLLQLALVHRAKDLKETWDLICAYCLSPRTCWTVLTRTYGMRCVLQSLRDGRRQIQDFCLEDCSGIQRQLVLASAAGTLAPPLNNPVGALSRGPLIAVE